MGLRGGPLDFAGLGGAALLVVVALALIGIVAAIRGYWGSSARARRVTFLAAVVTLPVGFLVGAALLIQGYDLLARLGPAATQADAGYVWRRALSPAIAACLAFCGVVAVAGAGWLRERTAAPGDEPPPRKPAR